MLDEFNKLHATMKFKIDTEFPDERLISIMKPYLLLYVTSLYSLVAIIKSNTFAKLKFKLTQFYKFNPTFGRKTAVVNFSKLKVTNHITNNPKPCIKKYVFNDKHIDFFKTENDTFFENHKTVKGLYNVDYLRILVGQQATNTNIFLISDDSEDETHNSDDEDDADANMDTEDDDADANMDTEDDAADNIQYEYTYEYNYHT
jgi:hypothetical protein